MFPLITFPVDVYVRADQRNQWEKGLLGCKKGWEIYDNSVYSKVNEKETRKEPHCRGCLAEWSVGTSSFR